ncbi:minichromosome maintenance domain-containing protein 2-like isoform X2 [Amphibalanus amphitrite]|nr:minichromosome maintenance domain-containing protein 2-like isoform X2 [Amphibalanus amphitrite]
MIAVSGILLSRTLPEKFVECMRHVCENSYCAEELISVFVPGRPPPGTFTDCTNCGANLREDVGCRRLSEATEGFLVPLEALEAPLKPCKGRFQSVRVVFRGELCRDLHLGGRYRVVGQLVKVSEGSSCRLTLEAASVRPIPLSIYAQPLVCAISPVIETLYHDRRFSPWSFALSLAYVFASGLSPAGTYFRLKLGMLLSLVACGAIRHSRLQPLLAVGPDVGSLVRLLSHGAGLARRCVRHTCPGPLAGRAARPAVGGAARAELEAGSLLLARGGVCLLGDLSKYRREALHTLQKGLEVGSVSVVCPASLSGTGRPESVSMPLLCQPWAVYDCKPTGGTDLNSSLVSDSASLVGTQTNALPRTLTEAFGVVYYTESADDCDDLACDLATCQLLMAAGGGRVDQQLVPDKDLTAFLAAACELSLDLEPDAERLVRRYFVASRRVRTSNVPDVPVAAVSTISGLAHAFAQLSLRDCVTVDDVTMAILLYEESLAACFGYSPLDVSHTPHIREADLDANLGRQNDERMRDFQRRLEEFISEWALL